MKKLLLPILSLVLLLTACYDKDIQEINNRLDNIENQNIATLQEQVNAISSSIPKLEQTDKELKAYIEALQATSKELQAKLDATNSNINYIITQLDHKIDSTKDEVLSQLESAKRELESQIGSINTTIDDLRAEDIQLLSKIAELNNLISAVNNSTMSWVSATFATLEQYNAIIGDIATIREQINALNKSISALETSLTNKINNDIATAVSSLTEELQQKVKDITDAYTNAIATAKNDITSAYTAAIQTAFSTLETSMKSWVNEQLTGYYDIAEINAKLEAIDKQIKAGDEENTKALNELKEQLEKSKTALTEAYQKAITEAITNNNGVINSKIAAEIAAVNKRIDNEVDAINTKIAALEERIEAIEDKLDEILGRKLDITFDVDSNIIVAPNYTLEIGYSVTSSTNSATVEVTSSADIKAKVVTNGLNGKISITTGNAIDEYSKVIVFVSNGENVIMRSITFEQATIQINNSDTKTIPVEGGKVELSFLTNVECEVVIPSGASSWLSVVPTTRALEERTITLQATANEGLNRSAVVTVQSVEGNLAVQYTINQMSNITILNYTTNDGKPLDPYTTEGFGAELAENSYDATTAKGFLKFNGKITTIPEKVFYNCTSLTSITIPDCVTEIESGAFSNCTSLTSVTIPDSVTEIGGNAFYGCISLIAFYGKFASVDNRCLVVNGMLHSFARAGLTEYTVPDSVTEIGDCAFQHCTSLTSVTIPDSVTSIGDAAFKYCTSLTSVTIPDSVASIGFSIFDGCTSLTSVTIPDSVTEIGECAFYGCISLFAFYGKFASADNRCLVVNGVLNSFAPAGLTEYTIPDSVTEIGDCAFQHCTSLTSVTIPDSVTKIRDYAFYGCTSLKEIYCNATIPPSLGGSTFDNNANGQRIYIYEECVWLYKSEWSDYKDNIYTNGKNCPDTTTIEYTTNDGNIIGPSNLPIISNSYKKGVGILIIVGKMAQIPELAFCACSSLTTINIPNSITSIGINAFHNCSSLTSITIPDSVTEIGQNAFYLCTSLTSVTIPDSVTSIGGSAFSGCTSLASVTIPDSVTSIGGSAFSGCTSLTSVTIPDSVTEIGRSAFEGCTSLKEVYCKPTTPPSGGLSMFLYNASGRKIYVPYASVDAYKNAQYWSEYADYIVDYGF